MPDTDGEVISKDHGKTVIIAGLVSVVVGALVAIVLAATAGGGPYWSDGFQLIVYMVAAVMVAGVLGLIFGVPRAREDSGAPTTERFLANSNLEQISDWLTKVLVGAGLVQLGALAGGLSALGEYLGADLRIRNAEAVAVAISLYGLGLGFTFVYLWSRLSLRVQLEDSERQARERSGQQKATEALLQANATSDNPEPASVVTSVVSAAVKRTELSPTPGRPRTVLWVDDYPVNNTPTADALRHVGIRVDIARSTQEAMRRLDERTYGALITDLGRREDGVEKPEAGLELLAAMRESHPDLPVIVYAGRRAVERKREIEDAGAVLSTNNPTEVFERTIELLT